eukprot:Lithocolla_globosa_v1_NODE_3011_length_1795_cov_23.414368.p3 type:complete len:104 gc:universal NODE_3011_length_1795_cov_23.414368:903-1214(+)
MSDTSVHLSWQECLFKLPLSTRDSSILSPSPIPLNTSVTFFQPKLLLLPVLVLLLLCQSLWNVLKPQDAYPPPLLALSFLWGLLSTWTEAPFTFHAVVFGWLS